LHALPSSVAATSLGLVGKEHLEKRVGRNEALNHTGNVIAAIVAGILGQFVGRAWIFYFFVILCIFTIFSVFQIRKKDIDNTQARGDDKIIIANKKRQNFHVFCVCAENKTSAKIHKPDTDVPPERLYS
jgi:predicted MFS family arabinose efflux permease